MSEATAIVIHATPADQSVVAKTVPHLLADKRPEVAVFLVVDSVPLTGRLAANQPRFVDGPSTNDALAGLCAKQAGLRLVHTPRTPDHIGEIGTTFFGDRSVAPNCAAGTPVYPFLAGLLVPQTRYVVHYDADMLLHDPGDWVAAGLDLMQHDRSVVIVNPHRGSGRSGCRIQGREAQCSCSPSAQSVSTRCFLVDLRRLLEFTPLTRYRHGWPRRIRYLLERRSTVRPLEHILNDSLRDNGTRMATLTSATAFTIHGLHRRYFEDEQIDATIAAVVKGNFPSRQQGEENLVGLW